ncbi:MAG: hypothetical protein GY953_09815, partial [bacterium]|nr:hypothetical protein [bacterium]
MDYLDVEEARHRPGLRLVLSAGVPGPWGEAAKGVFQVKGIPYAPVRQIGGMDNPALRDWTGQDNAPIAIYENERPRSHWSDIVHLAERLEPEPALIPSDPEARIEMFGLLHEISGEQGFLWCRRLMMLAGMKGDAAAALPDFMRGIVQNLADKYGYTEATARTASGRVTQIMEFLSGRLLAQKRRGSAYLVGDDLSAADIYWATGSAMLEPLPAEVCPMPEPI